MANETRIDPIDAQVGGDGDIDGIAQTITSDDIDAVLMSERSSDQRLQELKSMRDDLEARSHADFGSEMQPLVEQIDAAIERLSQ